MKLHLIAALTIVMITGCSTGDPTATQFKNGDIETKNLSNQGGGAAGAVDTNGGIDPNATADPNAVEDPNAEEAPPVETPEEKAAREAAEAEALRLQSVAAGKVVFDGMCIGCHVAAAAGAGGTLNARDGAVIAAASALPQHGAIAANFPNAAVSAQVADFLLDANGMVAAAGN